MVLHMFSCGMVGSTPEHSISAITSHLANTYMGRAHRYCILLVSGTRTLPYRYSMTNCKCLSLVASSSSVYCISF